MDCFRDNSFTCAVSESETRLPANRSKKRQFATPYLSYSSDEEIDGKKQCSSLSSCPTSPGCVPNFPGTVSLWDSDKVKARKVALEMAQAFISTVDQSYKDEYESMDFEERYEEDMLKSAQVVTHIFGVLENCKKLSEEAAESRLTISNLTQDLKEAQSEANLGKINLEISEKLVEQARQEKYIVELKSTRKIQELETELQELKDRFKDALSDSA